MDTYVVEIDWLNGFHVKVAGPDGRVYLTSLSLSTWSQAHQWIEDHQLSRKGNLSPTH
jgi:hypothetical protein